MHADVYIHPYFSEVYIYIYMFFYPTLISLYLLYLSQIITSSSFTLNDQTAAHLTEMASQGIKLLTSWTTAVMDMVCDTQS